MTVAPSDREAFERIFAGDTLACIGRIRQDEDIVFMKGPQENICRLTCQEAKEAWQRPLKF
jgi:hypothetical protein